MNLASKFIDPVQILMIQQEHLKETLTNYRGEDSYITAEQCVDYIDGIVETTNRILEMMQMAS